jgi:hypothetical protein
MLPAAQRILILILILISSAAGNIDYPQLPYSSVLPAALLIRISLVYLLPAALLVMLHLSFENLSSSWHAVSKYNDCNVSLKGCNV